MMIWLIRDFIRSFSRNTRRGALVAEGKDQRDIFISKKLNELK